MNGERMCICADPENCTERVPGYRCKRDFMPTETTKLATKEEWGEAWGMFNEGVRRLNRLAVQDGITVKLSMQTLGWVPRGKKVKS